jgi:hypothetical protein
MSGSASLPFEDQGKREADALRITISRLLSVLGEPAKCIGCGKDIIWMQRIVNSKRIPYDLDGVSHFATCPEAKLFRKG